MFIAFTGSMGVGKSTLAAALAKQLDAKVFIEPGAEHWPIPQDEPWQNHVPALESWVRHTNLQHFEQARELADTGQITIADGALFLINQNLLTADCCNWYYRHLQPADHAQRLTQAIHDYHHAPCPDILILLEADYTSCQQFLKTRGRSLDECKDLLANHNAMQTLITSAAETLAAHRNLHLIRYTNHLHTSPDSLATELRTLLLTK
jgi:deoxyadenosine/deoxycytidine kinase